NAENYQFRPSKSAARALISDRADLRDRGAEAPRVAKRTCKPERRDAVQLRNQLGAQARELLIGDRSLFIHTIKLTHLVPPAVTDHSSKLVPRLLRLLAASFGHASRLGDHVREYRKIGEHNQGYHPDRLAPTGYVVTPEKVAYDDDEQPEP